MGIHDIATMNEIRKAATAVDPSIIIYGEGWAAKAPQMPEDSLAMKANTYRMPGIAAFSDEMRDGLRGPFNDNHQGAFLAGVPGGEESIKFGIVGAIKHPQVDNDLVNYSKASWAEQPTQMVSYVSCHDDMCLVDRLNASVPGITPQELIKLDKLAQTAVFTSQGIPFIYAGEEVMRDKKGVHNSYQSPDSINAIDWKRKAEHADVFAYYKGLIQLRKNHPAFRMGDADLVRKHLEFLPVEGSNLIAYRLKEHANSDAWEDIIVALNSRKEPAKLTVPEGKYTVVCKDGFISEKGLGTLYESLSKSHSHLFMGIDGKLAAVISIKDPVRPESAEVVRKLKELGIGKVVMMTGDSERTAQAIAEQVGVDEYYSEVLPEDKARFVESEKAVGRKVIMVGDGINDSPALSASDAGIAVSDGAEIAREIADITVSADNLYELVTLKELSNKLMSRINRNYRKIVTFNTGLIILGVMGVIQPTTSALLHNSSTLLISMDSMKRLLD